MDLQRQKNTTSARQHGKAASVLLDNTEQVSAVHGSEDDEDDVTGKLLYIPSLTGGNDIYTFSELCSMPRATLNIVFCIIFEIAGRKRNQKSDPNQADVANWACMCCRTGGYCAKRPSGATANHFWLLVSRIYERASV